MIISNIKSVSNLIKFMPKISNFVINYRKRIKKFKFRKTVEILDELSFLKLNLKF